MSLLVVAALLVSALSVSAQENIYVSLETGLTLQEDAEDSREISLDEGWHGSGALGFKMGRFRIEGEVAYRESDVSEIKVGGNTFNASGDIAALSYMGNVYFDIENKSAWTPYVGGGVGAAQVSFNDVLGSTALNVDDEDLVLAYKFEAGLALAVDNNIDLFANYHYFATTDPSFTNSVTLSKFNTGYKSHNLGLGVNYRF